MEKTNVMRILDQKKIKYQCFEYPHEEKVAVDGIQVASLLNQNPEQVFKTLVAVSSTKHYYVFVIPVNKELNFKLCAQVVKEKSLELIPVKELLAVTGYIRGGCSPIGMKKNYKTLVDIRALDYPEIVFSAGKIGYQVQMNPRELTKIVPVEFYSITR